MYSNGTVNHVANELAILLYLSHARHNIGTTHNDITATLHITTYRALHFTWKLRVSRSS